MDGDGDVEGDTVTDPRDQVWVCERRALRVLRVGEGLCERPVGVAVWERLGLRSGVGESERVGKEPEREALQVDSVRVGDMVALAVLLQDRERVCVGVRVSSAVGGD